MAKRRIRKNIYDLNMVDLIFMTINEDFIDLEPEGLNEININTLTLVFDLFLSDTSLRLKQRFEDLMEKKNIESEKSKRERS